MPPPLGWLAGWQVCAPYIPSHSPLAARLRPNQKILQDIMRYAPKVDRWYFRWDEHPLPYSFPLVPPPLFFLLFNPPTNVIFRWKGSPGPRSSFWIARAPELFLDFLHLAERTRIVRFFFFFFEHWDDSAEISVRKGGEGFRIEGMGNGCWVYFCNFEIC